MFQIPADCLHDTVGKQGLRIPSQLVLDLRRVNGIACIVAETVGHMGDEIVVDPVYINVAIGIFYLLPKN